MEDLKSKLQLVYFVSNGFMFIVALLLLLFATPTGFLHYSPGEWLDYTIVVSAVVFGIIFPLWGKKIWYYFFKKIDIEPGTTVTGFEIAYILTSWVSFSLVILAFLYQTEQFTRIISAVIALFALVVCYPTEKKLSLTEKYFANLG